MPIFDPYRYAYPSRRNVVYAGRGMAASTSPIASQVGLDTMKAGGNAMDAAVAMAAVLGLRRPGVERPRGEALRPERLRGGPRGAVGGGGAAGGL